MLEAGAGREVLRDVGFGEEDLAPGEPEAAGGTACVAQSSSAPPKPASDVHDANTTSFFTTARRKRSPARRRSASRGFGTSRGRQVHVHREGRRHRPPASRSWASRSSGVGVESAELAGTVRQRYPASAITGQFSAGKLLSRSCSPARSAKMSARRPGEVEGLRLARGQQPSHAGEPIAFPKVDPLSVAAGPLKARITRAPLAVDMSGCGLRDSSICGHRARSATCSTDRRLTIGRSHSRRERMRGRGGVVLALATIVAAALASTAGAGSSSVTRTARPLTATAR